MEDYNSLKLIDCREHSSLIIIYGLDYEEILRFERNGEIFIHGKLATNDLEVVDGFREFLNQRGLI